LDVDEVIVERAKSMGIHIMRRAEGKNVSARLSKHAFMLKVHQRCDGNTLPTDKPPGVVQVFLTEFQGPFYKPTYANLEHGRQVDFDIKMDPNGTIRFCSPYCISPHE